MAFEVNNAILRDAVKRAGYPEPEPGVLHIWGARGAVPYTGGTPDDYLLTLKTNTIDEWNDTIGLFGTAFGIWRGTVDPGLPYTLDPLNTKGCAHLNNGCWSYQVGTHKGHTALVQAAEVTVTRDEDRDGTGELQEYQETGWFGIDIHSGSGAHVDEWSAGCQVVWDDVAYGAIWQAFLDPVLAAGQDTYRYYLLEAAALTS